MIRSVVRLLSVPAWWIAAAPAVGQPFHVDQTGRTPEGPPAAVDQAYDGRIRSSAAAAHGLQGPLQGAWALSAGGRDLYHLQLSDREGMIQGAWRDPRRPGALEGSGYLDVADRSDGSLVFSFTGAFAVLRLVDGRWTGRLTEGDRTVPVILVRRVP